MKPHLLLAAFCILGPEALAISYLTDGRALEIRGGGQYQGPSGSVSTQFNRTATPPVALGTWDTSLMETALLRLPTPRPPLFGPEEFGRSGADQYSFFGPDGFTAQGSASFHASLSGENYFGLNPRASGFAMSLFDIFFMVENPMTYQLSGQLQAANPFDLRNHATLVFTLVGGHNLLNLSDIDFRNARFEAAGVLSPGLYRLTASSIASAEVDRYDSSFLFADFAVAAEFANIRSVPEGDLPFWLVAFLFLALGLAQRQASMIKADN